AHAANTRALGTPGRRSARGAAVEQPARLRQLVGVIGVPARPLRAVGELHAPRTFGVEGEARAGGDRELVEGDEAGQRVVVAQAIEQPAHGDRLPRAPPRAVVE